MRRGGSVFFFLTLKKKYLIRQNRAAGQKVIEKKKSKKEFRWGGRQNKNNCKTVSTYQRDDSIVFAEIYCKTTKWFFCRVKRVERERTVSFFLQV